jgi:uncharacterized membrane protein YeiH
MTSTSFLPIEFDLAATFLMAMTGVWVASRRGYDILGAFTLAFVSGVGGGLLRDILVREESLLFKPGQFYVLAALGGCVLFVGLDYYGLPVEQAAAACICTTLLLRLLAIRFNWKTFAVAEWRSSSRTPVGGTDHRPDATEKEK